MKMTKQEKREKRLAYDRAYRKANPEKVRAWTRKSNRKWRAKIKGKALREKIETTAIGETIRVKHKNYLYEIFYELTCEEYFVKVYDIDSQGGITSNCMEYFDCQYEVVDYVYSSDKVLGGNDNE